MNEIVDPAVRMLGSIQDRLSVIRYIIRDAENNKLTPDDKIYLSLHAERMLSGWVGFFQSERGDAMVEAGHIKEDDPIPPYDDRFLVDSLVKSPHDYTPITSDPPM